ncbi:hypothetical protein V5O48_019493, partial [Marasmius crinis-equi]
VPMVTQSNPGSENNGIANAQTFIQQKLDPSLEGTLQHKWMKQTKNVKPEIQWSVYCRMWSPAFERLLEEGEQFGFYMPNDPDPIEKLTFQWLAIPFLQRQMDAYLNMRNSTPRRANRRKILPAGVPNHIFQSPENFMNAKDFTVSVPPEVFKEAEDMYAPEGDPVFEL